MDPQDDGVHPRRIANRDAPRRVLQPPAAGQHRVIHALSPGDVWRSFVMTGTLARSRIYPRPVSAGISTLTSMAPSQSTMEINATSLAVTGMTGARSHLGTLHSIASAETMASTMTSILMRNGVTAA